MYIKGIGLQHLHESVLTFISYYSTIFIAAVVCCQVHVHVHVHVYQTNSTYMYIYLSVLYIHIYYITCLGNCFYLLLIIIVSITVSCS